MGESKFGEFANVVGQNAQGKVNFAIGEGFLQLGVACVAVDDCDAGFGLASAFLVVSEFWVFGFFDVGLDASWADGVVDGF